MGPNKDGGSHRSNESKLLIDSIRRRFATLFGLERFDILFIPGSASLAMEMVIKSVHVRAIGEGKFTNRWREIGCRHDGFTLGTYLQTDISTVGFIHAPVLDCVSSFPYYDIPDTCKVFVTTTGKQLQCGQLSVIGVDRDFWKHVSSYTGWSYLDLRRWLDVPVTMPMDRFEELDYRLEDGLVEAIRWKIDKVSDDIVSAIGEDSIVGDKRCPVITINREVIAEKTAERFGLYQSDAGWQVFTYSDSLDNYGRLCDVLNDLH